VTSLIIRLTNQTKLSIFFERSKRRDQKTYRILGILCLILESLPIGQISPDSSHWSYEEALMKVPRRSIDFVLKTASSRQIFQVSGRKLLTERNKVDVPM